MISPQTKAKALAKLTHQIPLEEISAELDIPVMLLKEWEKNLGDKELLSLQSNIHAIQSLANEYGGELVNITEDQLKNSLEKAGLEIAQAVYKTASSGDIMHAKALQLCSDAVCKIYAAMVLKGGTVIPAGTNNGNGSSVFQRLMKD